MKVLPFLLLIIFSSCGGHRSSSDYEASSMAADYELPGLVSAYYENGNLKELNISGVKNIQGESPLLITDRFHIGSNTKAMTAFLVALLIEKNLLSWNSTLRELLSGLAIHPALREVTIEQLLSHHAGIRRDGEGHPELLSPATTRAQWAQIILKDPPAVSVGEYLYSNSGYIVLGHIIESLTQKTWEMLMVEMVFTPLKMNSCGFGPSPDVSGHLMVNRKIVPINQDSRPLYGPAGTTFCSISDWAKFLQEELNGLNGQSIFLTKASYDKLQEGTFYTPGGWGKVQRPWAYGDAFVHDGTNGYNFSKAWIAPKRNSFIISLTNIGGRRALEAIDHSLNQLIHKYLE